MPPRWNTTKKVCEHERKSVVVRSCVRSFYVSILGIISFVVPDYAFD